MIMEGVFRRNGDSKVALYQDEAVFKAVRDEDFTGDGGTWSSKAGYFENLESAKNYIQCARDEEGVHFAWPAKIPVIWKKGDLTTIDVSTFTGWEEVPEIYLP